MPFLFQLQVWRVYAIFAKNKNMKKREILTISSVIIMLVILPMITLSIESSTPWVALIFLALSIGIVVINPQVIPFIFVKNYTPEDYDDNKKIEKTKETTEMDDFVSSSLKIVAYMIQYSPHAERNSEINEYISHVDPNNYDMRVMELNHDKELAFSSVKEMCEAINNSEDVTHEKKLLLLDYLFRISYSPKDDLQEFARIGNYLKISNPEFQNIVSKANRQKRNLKS